MSCWSLVCLIPFITNVLFKELFSTLLHSENFDEKEVFRNDPLSEKIAEGVEMDEEKRARVEDLAHRIGMSPQDVQFQEGVFLAKHVEKCRYCSMLWNATNEVTSSHAREDAI